MLDNNVMLGTLGSKCVTVFLKVEGRVWHCCYSTWGTVLYHLLYKSGGTRLCLFWQPGVEVNVGVSLDTTAVILILCLICSTELNSIVNLSNMIVKCANGKSKV